MNIKGRVKKFCFKVLNKIEDHLAKIVAGGFILIGSTLCVIFWKWLRTKHSIEMYGWMYFSILLIFSLVLVYFLYTSYKYFGKIKEPSDIRNVLRKWWRHCTEQNREQREFTLYFSSIDKKERLKSGSSKKYLREVVTKDAHWSIVREGLKTLTVRRKEFTITVGPDGPLSL